MADIEVRVTEREWTPTDYPLWCLVCSPKPAPKNVIRFAAPEDRRAWIPAHKQATGHDSFLCPNLTANG